jgi:hypothetical protein
METVLELLVRQEQRVHLEVPSVALPEHCHLLMVVLEQLLQRFLVPLVVFEGHLLLVFVIGRSASFP